MASKTLFQSLFGKLLPKADAVNEAGGSAYSFSRKHALAQYASTGCLNSTFYASDDEQLAKVLELCNGVEPEFIARAALYAHYSTPSNINSGYRAPTFRKQFCHFKM